MVTQAQGSVSQPFGYTGEVQDPSGLVDLRARMYDPSSGRFLQRDSWAGTRAQPATENRFAYTANDPATFTDPSGHCFEDGCVGEGAAAVAACMAYCQAIVAGAAALGTALLMNGQHITHAVNQLFEDSGPGLASQLSTFPAADQVSAMSVPADDENACPGLFGPHGEISHSDSSPRDPGAGNPVSPRRAQVANWWTNILAVVLAFVGQQGGHSLADLNPGHWGESLDSPAPYTVVVDSVPPPVKNIVVRGPCP